MKKKTTTKKKSARPIPPPPPGWMLSGINAKALLLCWDNKALEEGDQ